MLTLRGSLGYKNKEKTEESLDVSA